MIRGLRIAIVFAMAYQLQALPKYSLVAVPSGTAVETRPSGINIHGDIAGGTVANWGVPSSSFMWVGGVFSILPNLGTGIMAVASGITDSGTVVGFSCTQPVGCYPLHSYLYSAGQMTDIAPYIGNYVSAKDINNNGVVVGLGTGGSTGEGVFIFDSRTNTTTWVPGMGGETFRSWAEGINDLGHVAGYQRIAPGSTSESRAFSYIDGVLTNLGTLGGSSYGIDINNAGTVVGFSQIAPGGFRHAFVYKDGVMTDIHPGLGYNETLAFEISADGSAIIGVGFDSIGRKRAIAWFDGVFVDLNTLIPSDSGWTLHSAGYMNARGQIAGYGDIGDGAIRTYRLDPVPEPGTLALLLAGAGLLVFRTARREHPGTVTSRV